MIEIKGIDVSSEQDKPDWARVAADGMTFAILRIHQRYGIDSSFEHNYKGCKNNGILIGGYKYSYALNVAQAEAEADAVLAVLNGRGLDFPVFYDLEWSKQRKQCSRTTITKITKAFLEKVRAAGYKVGIYCNMDWYNNALDTGSLPYDYWLAAYPYNDNGTVQERLRPKYGVGWQYSSKGTVPGISGAVDMDVFYKDYKEDKPMGVTANDIIKIMQSWVGLSRSAGTHKPIIDLYNSHKPLARGYKVTYSDSYCDTTVSAAFIKANAVSLIGGTECGVEEHVKIFKNAGIWKEDGKLTPEPGWIVCYNWDDSTQPNDGYSDHIGIVESVNKSKKTFVVIEGNMSGGVVGRRTVSFGWGYIRGFAVPKYAKASAATSSPASNKVPVTKEVTLTLPKLSKGCTGVAVKMLQQMLGVKVDGTFGTETEASLKVFQKNVKLDQTGVCTVSVWQAIAAHMRANTYK